LGFERAWAASKLALRLKSSAAVTVYLYSDIPEPGTQVTAQSVSTGGDLESLTLTLPHTARGRLWRLKVVPPSGVTVRLESARIWARAMGGAATDWSWIKIPLRATPEGFVEGHIGLRETPDEFAAAHLPLRETPDEFAAAHLPLRETPDGWLSVDLPLPAAPDGWQGAEIPMDE
jgi:hypothetical protein